MYKLWPIAVITFKEGIRNRAMYGISVLALLLLSANLLISGMIMRDVGKVAIDMALSAVSFSGLLIVLFVGINLIAKDLDRKTIYMVLARPISRAQYICGKFFGLVLLLLVAMLTLSVAAVLSIILVKMNYADYFLRFSWFAIIQALAFSCLSLILLMALSFFFSSFSSSSFISLIYTVIAYLVGHSIGDIKALVESPDAVGIQVSAATAKVVQIAYHIFPNLSLFDIKTQAAHALEIPLGYSLWVIGYAVVYICLVISLAAVIFSRREFP